MKSQNGKGEKLPRIIGWICTILGGLIIITTYISHFDWKSKEMEYTKQYAFSDAAEDIYYESNGEKIFVKTLYNTYNEEIELKIPENKTVVIYSNNDNPEECIYFNMDNTSDQTMLKPSLGLIAPLFLISFGWYLLKSNQTFFTRCYIGYVSLFILGFIFLEGELININKYFKLKGEENITTATIFSEIYNYSSDSNTYKPVMYYFVDGQKYIYENDIYINGELDDKYGDTVELYYNLENPNIAIKKDNPVNIFMILLGTMLIVFMFPFVFLAPKMEKRLKKRMDDEE